MSSIINVEVATANRNTEHVAIQIALGIHKADPQDMPLDLQLRAIDAAANYGDEEFIDTIIALLPLELRDAACQAWDRLN